MAGRQVGAGRPCWLDREKLYPEKPDPKTIFHNPVRKFPQKLFRIRLALLSGNVVSAGQLLEIREAAYQSGTLYQKNAAGALWSAFLNEHQFQRHIARVLFF